MSTNFIKIKTKKCLKKSKKYRLKSSRDEKYIFIDSQ